ncbi:hypothetical protein IMG5_170860 [Ichthyophthirius multifiliis]|uniref:EF-hand domain-containing protein n=1 Tax=Ichthyophthirius multifiliis TaxID=5932 RepID=G0R1J1_ICHMU|nr:hypothetical protein IMG5_170860 [Ichthyophthirius multifiliis]EGR28664.1 hypothetical protein IMG5_170860 [Ichthyophthirius multifiliis]|eukprot:XP_004029900.1 hypothetical protein IMG5_170860 [Ichthyophthirius multifiliis]
MGNNPQKPQVIYTFKAYDKDGDNRISRKEFIEFFEDSWKAAFMILGDTANKTRFNQQTINTAKLNGWAQQNIPNLNHQIENIFSQLDRNKKGFIDYLTFQSWVKSSNMHSIFANFDNIKIEVPIDFYQLEKNTQ